MKREAKMMRGKDVERERSLYTVRPGAELGNRQVILGTAEHTLTKRQLDYADKRGGKTII